MRKRLLTAAIAGLLAVAPMAASADTTISVTLQLPETHSLGENWKNFGKIIEEKSGGELKIRLFPSAQLFKDKDVPGAVGSGAVQAGSSFIGRFAGAVPAVDVIAIPFIFKDEAHIRSSLAPGSEMRAAIDDAILEETGARILWWQAFGRNVYLNNGSPIATPADLKGKKVRTYGKVHGWTVEALGGAPTLMSGSNQFLAYQTGVVDVGMTGVSAVKSRNLYEVMDHATLTFDSAIEFVAVMNNDFYEGLPDEHRAIIDAAAKQVEQELRDQIYSQEAVTVEELKSKMTVVELTEAERNEWVTATKGVVDRFKEEAGETGAKAVAAIAASN